MIGAFKNKSFYFRIKANESARRAKTFQTQGFTAKMATPAKPSISRKEAIDAYARLKNKAKRANEVAKRESEAMMRNLVTVGAGGLMGWYLGDAEKKGGVAATKVQDIDIDLIVGGGALAAGMMKWGGKFSETLSAIGTGVLTQYIGRMGYDKGKK
jgi:hypothetical protein